jgi:hypothetical protein
MESSTVRRPGPWHTALGLLVLAVACHHPALPTTITVGPKRELLIHGIVNATPVVLQIDTGASNTSLTPAVCRRLGLHTGPVQFGAPLVGRGAGGSLAEVTWTVVQRLRFASEILHLHPVAVIDVDTADGAAAVAAPTRALPAAASIDGLLGMDVLGRYALDVDLRARRFALHGEDDTAFRSAGFASLGYAPLPGGQIALAVTIGGRPAIAVLDLGASKTFANTRVDLTPDDPDLVITAVIGADRHPLQFRAASDVPLVLGELALRVPSVWITDLPIFHTFGIADRPAVVLGTDVLADRRIVIDPFTRRVYLSR